MENRNQPKIGEAFDFIHRHPFWSLISARLLWAKAATPLSSNILMRFLFLVIWIAGKPILMMGSERVVGRR